MGPDNFMYQYFTHPPGQQAWSLWIKDIKDKKKTYASMTWTRGLCINDLLDTILSYASVTLTTNFMHEPEFKRLLRFYHKMAVTKQGKVRKSLKLFTKSQWHRGKSILLFPIRQRLRHDWHLQLMGRQSIRDLWPSASNQNGVNFYNYTRSSIII